MFVYSRAQDVKDFISELQLTKGRWAYENFKLLDWQNELIDKLFGNIDENGYRVYRKCLCFIAKKNGKSNLGAAIALYLLLMDGEVGAEIYSVASDRKQASIVFNIASQMVRFSTELSGKLKIIESQKRIVHYKSGSFYEVLSSDVETKHGFNPHAVIFDELHTQPNRKLWDVLTEGSMEARTQPIVFAMTTAGYDKNSICYEVYDYAKKVDAEIIKDEHFLPILYELDESDDWEDESNWNKANPSLGTKEQVEAKEKILDIERFREAYREAKEIPAKENTFKRLRLNMWTSQETRWLDMDYWNACRGEVNQQELKGRVCYGGLDLSSTDDLAAFDLTFPYDDKVKVLPFFFMPADNIEKRVHRDRVPYDVWVRQGLIYATPGNVIDYGFIFNKICELAKIYEIKEIAFDPYNALMLNQELADEGFRMVEVRQGMKSLSPPTKHLETLILGGKLEHGGNPVLTWMFNNVMIITDANDNRRIDKEKSREKIDGIQALIMAISRVMVQEDKESIYETEKIKVF